MRDYWHKCIKKIIVLIKIYFVAKKLLILYHSQSGNTEKLAKAILNGASTQENIEIKLKKALEGKVEDLLWSDAVLFGTPEIFGFMSGGLKYFFDETYYPAKEQAQLNICYAIFISCENNGTGAVHQIEQIASGYPLRKSLPPLLVKGKISEMNLQEAFEFGQTMAAGLVDEIF